MYARAVAGQTSVRSAARHLIVIEIAIKFEWWHHVPMKNTDESLYHPSRFIRLLKASLGSGLRL
jgi:hypothetical protein